MFVFGITIILGVTSVVFPVAHKKEEMAGSAEGLVQNVWG
jgi:hypothetical protein